MSDRVTRKRVAPVVEEVVEEAPQPTKKKRRTKAEVQAEKQAKEAARLEKERVAAEKKRAREEVKTNEEGEVDDEAAYGATYNELRKPARISPRDALLSAADFNDASRLKEWYESLKLSEGTVKTTMSQWNRFLEFNQTYDKKMKPLDFIKNHLPYCIDRIKEHPSYSTGSKKALTAMLIHLIDHFPLTRNDKTFIESDDVRELRVYNNLLKFKSSELAENRGASLYYPLNSKVKEQIELLTEEELRVYAMTMMELPLRNDLVLVIVNREEEMKNPNNNYVLIPRDETKPVQIKLNVFKTSNFADRYSTLHNCSEPLSAAIRVFRDRKFDGTQAGKKYLFRDNKQAMGSINKLVIERLGYTYLDGGKSFWRRLAVSNMFYEIDQGRKTIEDAIVLAQSMQHSLEAAKNSYRHGINDGSYQTERGRKIMCKRVQQCIVESASLVATVVDDEKSGEPPEEKKDDEDEA